jgi:hypothetical protein
MGVYLIGVHFIGVCLMDVVLIGVHVMGVHLQARILQAYMHSLITEGDCKCNLTAEVNYSESSGDSRKKGLRAGIRRGCLGPERRAKLIIVLPWNTPINLDSVSNSIISSSSSRSSKGDPRAITALFRASTSLFFKSNAVILVLVRPGASVKS